MREMRSPGRQLVVRLTGTETEPLRILHPCRCDAPDPEAERLEPLEVPLDALLAAGQVLVVCPECDYHLLVVRDTAGNT